MIDNKTDLSKYLSLWQRISENDFVPLSHDRLKNKLNAITPERSGQDILNQLRADGIISSDMHGEYILTEKGRRLRLELGDNVNLPKESLSQLTTQKKHVSPDEWKRFRKLLPYYIKCIHQQEKSQEYLFKNDENKKFFLPKSLGFSWLNELGKDFSDITITIPKEANAAFNQILASSDEGEEIYIGYPLEAFVSKDKTCYSPIGLIPIDIKDFSRTTLTFRVKADEAEINQAWLEYRINKDRKDALMHGLTMFHKDDDYNGLVDLALALPCLESEIKSDFKTKFDPNKLEQFLPELTKGSKACNTAVIFVGERLRYTKTLKAELNYISSVSDEVLEQTALAYIFREHPLPFLKEDTEEMPFPFISCNEAQRNAVFQALNQPISKVTGPPGTGKSQVAVNIIANLIYRGKSVLFTSKNHKAVHAIEDRSQSILENSGLSLVHFCSNEDSSKSNPWYSQDIDLLIAKAESFFKPQDAIHDFYVQKANDRWKVVEKYYALRGKLLSEMEKAYVEVEKLRLCIGRRLQNEEKWSFSKADLNNISFILKYLKDPPPSGFSHWISKICWKLWRKKYSEQAMTLAREEFPDIYSKSFGIEDFKKSLQSVKSLFPSYFKAQKVFDEIAEQTKNLPSLDKGKKQIEECLKLLEKNLIPSIKFRLGAKISQLVQENEKISFLKNIMLILKKGNDPFFFRRVRKEEYKKAEDGFILFSEYFPGWATTLLSLTKAAPCIPALFDKVIIDEASQCEIPPIIPALFRSKTVTVIGDPNQFTPVLDLKKTRHKYHALKYRIDDLKDQQFDFLERTAYDITNVHPVMLKEHFRCSTEIADYFNKEFYGDNLVIRTDKTALKFPSCLGYRHAVEWRDIPNSMDEEINEACRLVKKLVDNDYEGSIGVVTPFRAIADTLKQKMHSLSSKREDLVINTANGFQGGEKDVMIFVLGFNDSLSSGQRWYAGAEENRYIYNVAVSRAKACLIVIGDRTRCAKSDIRVLRSLAEIPRAPTAPKNMFDSVWERRFYNALLSAGIEAIPQYPLVGRRLDLAVISDNIKLDIEVDGVKYHTTEEGNRKTDDLFRDLQVEGVGWKVLRFWVYELQNDMDACVLKVKEILKQ